MTKLSMLAALSAIFLTLPASAQQIEPSASGLASELSDQAKQLGNVSVGLGKVSTRVASLESDQVDNEKRMSSIVACEQALAKRVAELEEHEAARTKSDAVKVYKDAEVERRLSGVQNQVTILHSAKADRADLQKTRDQVANCLNMLRNKK